MGLFKNGKKFNLFIVGIFCVNLLQAIFTPILKDEAYYWRWAQNLDWGYFDHPPMVTFIIKLGTFLFPGALGIRFVTVLLNIAMIFVIWALVPNSHKKQKNAEWIFFSVLLAMPFFHLYGFVTTPDAPLLFFSALYLLAIKKFEKKDNLLNILFLCVSASLLIYTKYFGGIVILLSLLFKPNLFKKRSLYLAGILTFILLLPYINWLYNHDFITLKYHLFQRKSIGRFRSKFILGYLFSTLGVLNPALFSVIFYQLFKKNPFVYKKYTFLRRMFVGYILFFFIYSFRSWIEAHWVAFAIIPMTVVLFDMCILNPKIFNKLRYALVISILLLFTFRLTLIFDFLPIKTEFNSHKADYFMAIKALAKDRKVIFINSYQNASKYNFYSGDKSYSINEICYRKNQYNLWNFENELDSQKVLIVGNRPSNLLINSWVEPIKDSLILDSGEYFKYKKIDRFRLLNNLKAEIVKFPKKINQNTRGNISLQIYNPYVKDLFLDKKRQHYQLALNFEKDNVNHIVPLFYNKDYNLKAGIKSFLEANYSFNNIQQGKYHLSVVIKDNNLYFVNMSNIYDIEVK